MSKILICGDSFAVTDPSYPGLHWSEKILNFSSDFEVLNLSYGGSSNALILMQLMQGLRFNPDFVIFNFTTGDRYEYDDDVNALPNSTNVIDIVDFLKRRYSTNKHEKNTDKNKETIRYFTGYASPNFELLKNYFYISSCLNIAANNNINFCYTLGGFFHNQNLNLFLNKNFISDELSKFKNREILTNLWDYWDLTRHKSIPFFHVSDPKVQTLFANECIDYILGNRD